MYLLTQRINNTYTSDNHIKIRLGPIPNPIVAYRFASAPLQAS